MFLLVSFGVGDEMIGGGGRCQVLSVAERGAWKNIR